MILKKNALNALVGGIMSKLTSGEFLAGASAAGINKLVIEEIRLQMVILIRCSGLVLS